MSLLAASMLLVYLMHGLTEAHFHFFVMVGLVSLYQDWVPFGVALVVVLIHHGVLGTLFPHSVFGHSAAHHNPWAWAGVHGAFVLAASLAHLAAWRLNEQQGLRDQLTGLANRTLLVETTDRLLQRRHRRGHRAPARRRRLQGRQRRPRARGRGPAAAGRRRAAAGLRPPRGRRRAARRRRVRRRRRQRAHDSAGRSASGCSSRWPTRC